MFYSCTKRTQVQANRISLLPLVAHVNLPLIKKKTTSDESFFGAVECEFFVCVCVVGCAKNVCVCPLHVHRKPLMRVYSILDNGRLDATRGNKSRAEGGRQG